MKIKKFITLLYLILILTSCSDNEPIPQIAVKWKVSAFMPDVAFVQVWIGGKIKQDKIYFKNGLSEGTLQINKGDELMLKVLNPYPDPYPYFHVTVNSFNQHVPRRNDCECVFKYIIE